VTLLILKRVSLWGIRKKVGNNDLPQQRYPLKKPCRDGTTGDRRSHAIFEPLDFIARLAAVVPKPRVNLTRFHGVFARGGPRGAALAGRPSTGWAPPNSRHRVTITPALRNKAKKALPTGQQKTRAQKHQSMTWAQKLKRFLTSALKPLSNAVVRLTL
jgi:hypothetical protein